MSVALDATPLLGLPTGVGAFCAGALQGLAARHDVEVSAFAVSWRRRRLIVDRVPSEVSTVQHAMPARPLHRAWERWSYPPVEWFIGRNHVVHGTNFVVPPARDAARVVTVHDLTVVRYPELCDRSTLGFPALVRRAAAEGAWIHTPSEFVAAEVIEAFGVDAARVRAVHHGVPPLPGAAEHDAAADRTGLVVGGDHGDPSERSPLSPAIPVDLPCGAARYVLAVGTIEPRKDYPSLVSAFNALAAVHPDVALVIVGADGWGAERLRVAVEASPFRSRIVRPGYLDDERLATVMRHAAVLAYPSVYEGFGFPPLQAMTVGVPVVATAVGAVPEVVGDGAVMVSAGDHDALAGALDHVLTGGADVDALIARGRLRSARFTWVTCATGLVSLYRDAWADTRARSGRRATSSGPNSSGSRP